MIFNKEKIQRIKEIIKRRNLMFMFNTLGSDSLTDEDIKFLQDQGIDIKALTPRDLIQDTYFAGLTRADISEGGYENTPLDSFQSTAKPYITDLQRYAIEHVKEQAAANAKQLEAKLAQDSETAIRSGNLEYRNFLMTNKEATVFEQNIERDAQIGQITRDLQNMTQDYNRDWKRVAVTEMTNAHSQGRADAIQVRNEKKKPDDIYVFKRVVGDEALCSSCRKAYLETDGITPKVYKLSELQANGTNVGKKRVNWDAVVGATHPFCRCVLNELPNGFGFNDKGQMTYKGPDFIYYEDKK